MGFPKKITELPLRTVLKNTDLFVSVDTDTDSTNKVTLESLATFIGGGNQYVTGGTYNEITESIDFVGNSGFPSFSVNVSGLTEDTYVTGATLNVAILEIGRNNGEPLISIDLSSLSGDTNTFVSGATLVGTTYSLEKNDGTTIPTDFEPIISGKVDTTLFNVYTANTETEINSKLDKSNFNIYSANTQTEIDSKLNKSNFDTYSANTETEINSKLDKSNFDTYSANTQTEINSKISNGINNGGGNVIFSGKSDNDLYFKTLSGGSNTTLTNVGDVVKIDVTIPADTNTFITGTSLNNTTYTINQNDGSTFPTDFEPLISGFTSGNTLQEVIENGSVYSGTDIVQINSSNGIILSSNVLSTVSAVGLNTSGTKIKYEDSSNDKREISVYETEFKITDQITSKGVEYADDYSSNFTNRSLVDKEYVDGVVSGKVDTTLFNIYTANTETEIDSKLDITTFDNYTANTIDNNIFVSSGEADAATQQLTFTNTSGGTFNVVNAAALFSDNDINVTGGTYDNNTGCVTFTTNSGTTFPICGFITGLTDTYTTSGVYDDTTEEITFTRTDASTYTVDLSSLSATTPTIDQVIAEGNQLTNTNSSLLFPQSGSMDWNVSSGNQNFIVETGGSNGYIRISNEDGELEMGDSNRITLASFSGSDLELKTGSNTDDFRIYLGTSGPSVGDILEVQSLDGNTGLMGWSTPSAFDNVFVSSGEADAATQQLTFTNTTGGTFNVTNSAALFSDNDINVTGGTYDNNTGCVTFFTNSGTSFPICGFVTGLTDTFVTGGTLSGTNLILEKSNGINVNSIDLSSLSGGSMSSFIVDGDNGTPQTITNGETLTFEGSVGIDVGVAATDRVLIAVDYSGNDSVIMAANNGTGIIVDSTNDKLLIYDNDDTQVKYINANQLPNTFITNTTLVGTEYTINENNGSAFTTNFESIVSGKVDTTLFDTYTANTETEIDSKLDITAFDTYTANTADNNTFITGFTYNDNNTFIITDNEDNSFSATINEMSGLTINGDLTVNGVYSTMNVNEFSVVISGDNVFSVGQLGTQDVKVGELSISDKIDIGGKEVIIDTEALNLNQTLSQNNTETQLLVRNVTTGNVEYRDSSTLSGGGSSFTGNTSGTCISELWVSSISGCSPVNIGTGLEVEGGLTVDGAIIGTSPFSTKAGGDDIEWDYATDGPNIKVVLSSGSTNILTVDSTSSFPNGTSGYIIIDPSSSTDYKLPDESFGSGTGIKSYLSAADASLGGSNPVRLQYTYDGTNFWFDKFTNMIEPIYPPSVNFDTTDLIAFYHPESFNQAVSGGVSGGFAVPNISSSILIGDLAIGSDVTNFDFTVRDDTINQPAFWTMGDDENEIITPSTLGATIDTNNTVSFYMKGDYQTGYCGLIDFYDGSGIYEETLYLYNKFFRSYDPSFTFSYPELLDYSGDGGADLTSEWLFISYTIDESSNELALFVGCQSSLDAARAASGATNWDYSGLGDTVSVDANGLYSETASVTIDETTFDRFYYGNSAGGGEGALCSLGMLGIYSSVIPDSRIISNWESTRSTYYIS